MQQLLVAGKLFEWSLAIGTSEFKPLARFGDPDELEILRISSPGTGLDVAIRVFAYQYPDGIRRFLGPLLVLGNQFPNEQCPVQVGIMLELRPKLCRLSAIEPNSATVERIIQWCNSPHFKPRQVNSSGGRWVGYGRSSDA